MILFDTDVCVELLRGNENLLKRREKYDGIICISFMTVGELYYGVYKSKYQEKNILLLEEFLLSVKVIESNVQIMEKFGRIKSDLNKKRLTLTDADILIAATAMVECEKLITGNVNHYKRIEGLVIENWIN